ncbi:MAG: nitroreductase [Planctomycetes bacterium]|jgi:nitroreductase|nr:nitroreductase [Planctomycetota bacterium]
MDVFEAIQKRYSVRSYLDKPIEEDKLLRVLDAGRNAPSARNRQARKFVVVRDAHKRRLLASASEQASLASAPAVVAVVGTAPKDVMHCGVQTDPVDCAIAVDHMSLAATAEGLGTCWIGHFPQDQCRKILGVPESMVIIELMAIGYPSSSQPARTRKNLNEVVCWESYS